MDSTQIDYATSEYFEERITYSHFVLHCHSERGEPCCNVKCSRKIRQESERNLIHQDQSNKQKAGNKKIVFTTFEP